MRSGKTGEMQMQKLMLRGLMAGRKGLMMMPTGVREAVLGSGRVGRDGVRLRGGECWVELTACGGFLFRFCHSFYSTIVCVRYLDILYA